MLKLRCDSRFQRAFTAYISVFKVITVVYSNQRNYFENATACSKRTLNKMTVATQLKCSSYNFNYFDESELNKSELKVKFLIILPKGQIKILSLSLCNRISNFFSLKESRFRHLIANYFTSNMYSNLRLEIIHNSFLYLFYFFKMLFIFIPFSFFTHTHTNKHTHTFTQTHTYTHTRSVLPVERIFLGQLV